MTRTRIVLSLGCYYIEIGRSFIDKYHFLIKEELMLDGRIKLILEEKSSGSIVQKLVD